MEKYYDSTLTGEELDEALRNIPANVERSEKAATAAESWAQGGTNSRAGEDTDNAEYWAKQAKAGQTGAAASASAAKASEANAAASRDAAAKSATAAAGSATAAKASETAAAGSKDAAARSAGAAAASETNAAASKNAAGDLATRAEAAAESAGTDAGRAEAAAKLAQSIAQGQKGYYATPALLREAFPTGADGDWAIVGETDTIWVWDSDTKSWSNSGNKTDLSLYYTKAETDAEIDELQTALAKQIAAKQDAATAVTGVKGHAENTYRHGQVDITPANIGLGNVPNVATNDQAPTFTQAAARANLASGEKLSVLFGKLMKWYADLKAVAFSGSYNDLANKPTIPAALPLAGGTMAGDIAMGGHKVTGLATPTAATDAAPKQYVDALLAWESYKLVYGDRSGGYNDLDMYWNRKLKLIFFRFNWKVQPYTSGMTAPLPSSFPTYSKTMEFLNCGVTYSSSGTFSGFLSITLMADRTVRLTTEHQVSGVTTAACHGTNMVYFPYMDA